MPSTGFTAAQNGFHFANVFVNDLVHTPFGDITTYGRCGGMAFAALDFWHAGHPIPAETSASYPNGCPPDGTPLSTYIYQRMIASFICLSAAKFLSWTFGPDRKKGPFAGVIAITKNTEWPKLKARIDAGQPVPLGLITSGPNDLSQDHQVVACGYDEVLGGMTTVHIYDNRFPDQEMTLQSAPNNPHWNESNGDIWRGWFVQDYAAVLPGANVT